MKKILTILFILLSVKGYSQSTTPQFLGGKNSNLVIQSVFNMADSPKASFNLLLPDTTTAKTYFSGNLKGRWARQNGRLYHNPSGLKFMLADSVTGGGGGSADSATFYTNYRADTSRTNIYAAIASSGGSTDTTSLSARIDARVKYTDTAAMLANYLNSGDIGVSVQGYNANTTILGNTTSGSGGTILLQGSPTITLPNIAAINVSGGILSLPTGASGTLMRLSDTSTLSTRINNKLSISDTASMLSPYYRTATATASLANKLNILDTSTMLSPYLRKVDTTAMLSPYLRDADTTAMLANYATKQNLADTSATLRSLIGGGGVAVATAAELNTGTDNAKFASSLAIEGSKYLDQDGSKIYAVTTGTATAYVLTTTPSFTPATGTVLNVKFHVANTGAATINVNGSGAVALQKYLSNALVANDIPINSEYQLLRTSTGWLVKDIGLAGVTTGTGLPVRQTTANLITPVLGVATATSINKVAFTSPATAATLTLANGSTLATAGAFSTTLTATATTNITLPTTGTVATLAGTENLTNKSFPSLSSGTTNDSILVADAATGAVRRISSARIGGSGGGTPGGSTTQFQFNNAGAFGGTSGLTWDNVNNRMKFGGGTKTSELSIISSAAFGDGNIYVESSDGSGAAITLNSTSALGKKYSLFSRPTNTFGIYDYGAGAYVAEFDAPGYQSLRIRGTSVDGAGIALNPTASGGTTWTINSPATGSGLGAGRLVFFNGATRMTLLDNGTLSLGTTSPSASALLDLTSTTQGFLPPRMTGTQAAAIASKAEGLMVYVTDTSGGFAAKGWYGWNGAAWEKLNP